MIRVILRMIRVMSVSFCVCVVIYAFICIYVYIHICTQNLLRVSNPMSRIWACDVMSGIFEIQKCKRMIQKFTARWAWDQTYLKSYGCIYMYMYIDAYVCM